jgi:hypothetical protein
MNIRPIKYFGSPFWLTTAQFYVGNIGRIEKLFKEDLNNFNFLLQLQQAEPYLWKKAADTASCLLYDGFLLG